MRMRRPHRLAPARRARDRLEWPTLLVAASIYAGFGLVTWYHHALPVPLLALLGGWLVAWHGSLQHEVVHGHPSARRWLNELLVFPSLWLWLPFRRYRDTHLRHHTEPDLTDPVRDPESFYVTPECWARLGPLSRALLVLHNTAWGRLVIGPWLAVARSLHSDARAARRGDARVRRAWLLHVPACAVVLIWVVGVCGLSLPAYLGLFVYPGLALTLLRSFAEHRARPAPAERTAVVEAGFFFSLLYLNNNLHALHHAEPGLAWYRLPARYRTRRAELLTANGDYRYPGYAAILWRHGLRPREPLCHPLPSGAAAGASCRPAARPVGS